uniref:Uncharacterized protein n=1 Tax=Oncorhynchus mykiss TaxID=8022 RepID=A0A8K9UEV1_ONCMY
FGPIVKSCIMLIAISVVLLVQRHFANSISIETVLYEKLKNVVIMGFAAQFRHGLNYSWLQIQSLGPQKARAGSVCMCGYGFLKCCILLVSCLPYTVPKESIHTPYSTFFLLQSEFNMDSIRFSHQSTQNGP